MRQITGWIMTLSFLFFAYHFYKAIDTPVNEKPGVHQTKKK